MLIYRAGIFDYGEWYTPDAEIGIFTDLETAKQKAIDQKEYLDEEPYVEVLKLKDNEFMKVGEYKFTNNKWIYEET